MTTAAQVERLERLVEAFYQLGASLELEVVLQSTLDVATRLTNAEAGSIALLDETGSHLAFVATSDPDRERILEMRVPVGEGICGHVAQTGVAERIDQARTDARFFDGVDRRVGRETRSYLCVPLNVGDRVIGTAQLVNRRDGGSFDAADQELLEGFARQAALAIQNARFHELRLRQQALESELEVCSAVQRRLFPSAPPQIDGFEVYGCCVPCGEVGGDYYAFVSRPDGSWDLVLADVSGKGLPAAMMVADLHTGYQLLARHEPTLEIAVEELNRHLKATLLENKFVTLVALRVQPPSGRVEVVVAGHGPPLVVSPGGAVRRPAVSGPVLGMLERSFPAQAVELAPGEVLAVYSDGYSEIENPAGEMLGDNAIAAVIASSMGCGLDEVAARVDEAAARHRQGTRQHDDMTLLLLRRR